MARRSTSATGAATRVALATLLAVGLAGSVTAATDDSATFTIAQDVPTLTVVAIDESAASHGDLLIFEATITHEDGREGILRGSLLTVDLPDEAGDSLEDRIGQLVFDLGEGDSLVVAGTSVYEREADEMMPGAAQIRAVVGGTGRYVGARGEVATVRNEDGTYDHAFTLLD
jgi:hypothetical protein